MPLEEAVQLFLVRNNIDITFAKTYNKSNVYEKKGFEAFEQKRAGRSHLRDGEDQPFSGCSGA